MYQVTIRFGLDRITRNYGEQPNVATIRRDQQARAGLGYGDNINVLLNGVAMPDSAIIPSGAEVVVETAANTKAN